MNSLKITYLLCMVIMQISMMVAAVLIPIYVTPGQYWWTAFFLFCVLSDSVMFGKRMNLWTGGAQ